MFRAVNATEWIQSGAFFDWKGAKIFYRRQGTGAPMVMLHGFPTWSYDYAGVVERLSSKFDLITPDFLGYGASDKPRGRDFTVGDSADQVEALLAHLHVKRARLVIHDFGGIVGQELLDRHRDGRLSFELERVVLFNCGVVYELYRPATVQKLLAMPVVGSLVASLISASKVRSGLDAVRGPSHALSDDEFAQLWHGISLQDGHRLANRHIRYNAERAMHAGRWLAALEAWKGPLQLIWGLADPISGAHVLEALRPRVPEARVDALEGVGHFPMSEAPAEVAKLISD